MDSTKPRFSGEQLNDFLNNCSPSEHVGDAYEYQKDSINMLRSIGERVGYNELARIAVQLEMICGKHEYREVAEFKKNMCEREGWAIPEIVAKYAET